MTTPTTTQLDTPQGRADLRYAAEDQCRDMTRAEMARVIVTLIDDLERYRAALEWYADGAYYLRGYRGSSSCAEDDSGNRARQALGTGEGCGK